jgi:hypothetical protein
MPKRMTSATNRSRKQGVQPAGSAAPLSPVAGRRCRAASHTRRARASVSTAAARAGSRFRPSAACRGPVPSCDEHDRRTDDVVWAPSAPRSSSMPSTLTPWRGVVGQALHYEHEDVDGFVTSLVDAGHVPVEYTIEISGMRTGLLALRRCEGSVARSIPSPRHWGHMGGPAKRLPGSRHRFVPLAPRRSSPRSPLST